MQLCSFLKEIVDVVHYLYKVILNKKNSELLEMFSQGGNYSAMFISDNRVEDKIEVLDFKLEPGHSNDSILVDFLPP